MIQAPVRFFLGTNSPSGFRETVRELYHPDWRVVLLKGGPGTGKSTLMRRVAAALGGGELFCCSSDPDSVDAVRFPDRRLLLVDATAPHAVEPLCWDACESVISLSPCVDSRRLREHREELLSLGSEAEVCHARARRCLTGAAQALTDNRRLWREALDEPAVVGFAQRLAQREWENRETEGHSSRRFLGAITPSGSLTFFQTAQALCPRIFVVVDEDGAVSGLLMREWCRLAVAAGQRVLACPCPLSPDSRVEHLLLPDLGTAFLSSGPFHPVDFPVYRRIHGVRFADNDRLTEHQRKRHLNRRLARELLSGAAEAMGEAAALHRKRETLTAQAVDRQAVDQLTERLIRSLQEDVGC